MELFSIRIQRTFQLVSTKQVNGRDKQPENEPNNKKAYD